MTKTEKAKFNKAQQTKIDAKAKGGKPGTPKPTGTPKAPKVGGGGSKLADTGKKMGKWAKKFPKLAKSMKFLTKIPMIGKLFLAGPLIYALASGAGKKEIAPIIGQIFGGVGGAALGGMLGGLIGVAGGPLALITAALGGIAGAMVGDTLGTALAQWLVGDKVDAFGFGFGWINDIINGGKGPAEGGAPAAPADASAPVVEKPPLSDFKTPDYGGAITAKTDVGMKRQGKKAAKKIREDVLSGDLPYEDARMELEKLGMPDDKFVDTEMGWIDRQAAQRGIIPAITPDAKTAALGAIHTENATLKGQQDSAGSFVNNSPTNVTNNNSPTTLVLPGTNNAQGGMPIGKLTE